jgi:hypothetical protein
LPLVAYPAAHLQTNTKNKYTDFHVQEELLNPSSFSLTLSNRLRMLNHYF